MTRLVGHHDGDWAGGGGCASDESGGGVGRGDALA
ncbi:unnamed protein product [Linum tenue]|uniref:Uncharacterized protein n=1 Tax=Linum tenue TaxID=586396 RepID=A0AAV0J1Q7_9ROSI|nr:unnamed protein product [Linum tenue]CAI0625851.1 unnamed protein product [Linum tenue]